MTKESIPVQIARVQKMSVAELREEWQRLYNGAEPRVSNRVWLWKRLAWRVQELEYGGLSDAALQRLPVVQIAIVYDKDTIRIFRNGESYASYSTKSIDLLSIDNHFVTARTFDGHELLTSARVLDNRNGDRSLIRCQQTIVFD